VGGSGTSHRSGTYEGNVGCCRAAEGDAGGRSNKIGAINCNAVSARARASARVARTKSACHLDPPVGQVETGMTKLVCGTGTLAGACFFLLPLAINRGRCGKRAFMAE